MDLGSSLPGISDHLKSTLPHLEVPQSLHHLKSFSETPPPPPLLSSAKATFQTQLSNLSWPHTNKITTYASATYKADSLPFSIKSGKRVMKSEVSTMPPSLGSPHRQVLRRWTREDAKGLISGGESLFINTKNIKLARPGHLWV